MFKRTLLVSLLVLAVASGSAAFAKGKVTNTDNASDSPTPTIGVPQAVHEGTKANVEAQQAAAEINKEKTKSTFADATDKVVTEAKTVEENTEESTEAVDTIEATPTTSTPCTENKTTTTTTK